MCRAQSILYSGFPSYSGSRALVLQNIMLPIPHTYAYAPCCWKIISPEDSLAYHTCDVFTAKTEPKLAMERPLPARETWAIKTLNNTGALRSGSNLHSCTHNDRHHRAVLAVCHTCNWIIAMNTHRAWERIIRIRGLVVVSEWHQAPSVAHQIMRRLPMRWCLAWKRDGGVRIKPRDFDLGNLRVCVCVCTSN